MTDIERLANREDLREEWTRFLETEAAQVGLRALGSLARPVCVLTETAAMKASRLDYLAGYMDCIKQLQSIPLLGTRPEQSEETPWAHYAPTED